MALYSNSAKGFDGPQFALTDSQFVQEEFIFNSLPPDDFIVTEAGAGNFIISESGSFLIVE